MIIGAFLFPEVWRRHHPGHREAAELLETLAGYGVNALFMESDTYDEAWIALAHQAGLRWFAGISCFSDHAAGHQVLRDHPELWPIIENGERRPQMEWYVGITPTYDWYAEARLAAIEAAVRRYPIDGLLLDFVRWPLHWELECRPGAQPHQSSFDPHTLGRFERFLGTRIVGDTPAQQATWVLHHAMRPWVEFKCSVITEFVREAAARMRAIRGDLLKGAFVVPLEPEQQESLAGQRVPELAALLDLVAPMTYHAILHRSPEWVEEVARQAAHAAPGKALPVVQVDPREGVAAGADWGPPIPVEEWAAVARSVLRVPGIAGCVAFTGTALTLEGRGNVLRAAQAD